MCHRCRANLKRLSASLVCEACKHSFPIDDEIADFSEGKYYDSFSSEARLSYEEQLGLSREYAGTASRIRNFYLPLLRQRPHERVLDCGTGNGLAVDLLTSAGYEAWGVDLSQLRKWQWRERQNRHRLVVTDALRLPFESGYFDAVISSGVIEHIGVVEERLPRYRAMPLAAGTSFAARFFGS